MKKIMVLSGLLVCIPMLSFAEQFYDEETGNCIDLPEQLYNYENIAFPKDAKKTLQSVDNMEITNLTTDPLCQDR